MAELARPTLEDFPALTSLTGTLGAILIHPDVIARIAGMAAAEIPGVTLGPRFSFADILPGKEPVRGLQVEQTESGTYRIVCEVKMAYKTPMRERAEELQRHVKETVERMASLELEAVDIRIIDIYVEKEKKEEEAK